MTFASPKALNQLGLMYNPTSFKTHIPLMTDNSSSEIMIETEGLSKYYGKFVAVENLSFSIKEG